MSTALLVQREPELRGQTVVVIGGGLAIGLETARRARIERASVILSGRTPERLERDANELGALSTSAFDATEPVPLEQFFRNLPAPIDHVMVTPGRPRHGGRRPGIGLGICIDAHHRDPAFTANLALELAPVRVNLIAAGSVDTPLSASFLGDQLDNRRDQLRAKLPIRRVATPVDVAALAVHTALTGATCTHRRALGMEAIPRYRDNQVRCRLLVARRRRSVRG